MNHNPTILQTESNHKDYKFKQNPESATKEIFQTN
jgi:hypothetical protein